MTIPPFPLTGSDGIPALGLGTWNLRGAECVRVVQKAISLGYTHIDTAEMYRNEEEIGKAIRKTERGQLFITSKVWYDNLPRSSLLKACKNSLRRLNTDYLDLYLIHWPNQSIPMQESIEALAQLHHEGNVRNIGVSNFTERHLESARQLTSAPISVNQVEFHPFLHQKELLEYCTRHSIVITGYTPLAKGQVLINAAIQKIAVDHGKTPVQVALRWLVQKGIVVIPKAASSAHLKENMDIFDWSLSPEEMNMLDTLPDRRRFGNWGNSEFND